ncbi:hypothetical protein [Chitinophaga ginsengisoli]|uniref:Uncharacterized protein n=1 Tax=Chitinophaga ginsengisoli TaxID=363837 RepID=A0A2P8FXJ3_9BACT|nr:hypothetical protein [Chitinophaga ginsengisoli]PSL26443.1 hypothetical protein CLV42_111157 [Chitinophaga ginsengisoli]
MNAPQVAVGEVFPIPMPDGTTTGGHYLNFTTTLFNISYYTQTPKQHAMLVNKGGFKVYFAAIGPIPLVKIQTPLGPLYFVPNPMALSDKEFADWTSERKFAPTRITFYLLNMRNIVIDSHNIIVTRQWHIYDTTKHLLKVFNTPQQVDEEVDCIFKTYSHQALEERFIMIG